MKKSIYIIALLLLAILGGGWWLFNTYVEIEKPTIKYNQDLSAIGRQTILGITFADRKSGLRNTTVSLTQEGKTTVISSLNYPQRGTRQQALSLSLDPISLKLRNGAATLNITAVDYSLLKNQAASSRQINIDTLPPQIYLLNPINNINSGGTGVIVYRTSEPVTMSGVEIDNYLFKGYPIAIAGKPCIISYFAMPVEAGKSTQIRVVAKDQAGNASSIALPYLLKHRKFRSDKMDITDSFLQQKMPDFQNANADLRNKSLLDTFIYVNGKMRDENWKTIQSICQITSANALWQDTFLRMKNGAPMALYGDKRTYVYGGKNIGESVHMGVDLASTQHAPIEAANNGIVAFTGDLGIYGNAVIIDHGLGLFSLYAHQSEIKVQKGMNVKKGDIIGYSGMSGLAGGDHLHFAIILGGQFVDPREWWDPHWIADNVQNKMAVSF